MERNTSRCPAACSRPALASWIAGFFSSVVWKTYSKVTALVGRARQIMKIMAMNFEQRALRSGEHRPLACRLPQLAANSLRHLLYLRSNPFGQRPNATGSQPVLPRDRDSRFIADPISEAASPDRKPAQNCDSPFSHL